MQKNFLSSEAVILPLEILPQSLSTLVGYAAIYSLFCCSKGRGVTHCWNKTGLVSCQGNVTKLSFKCAPCMLPWLAHRWYTAFAVRKKANAWYFHLMVYAGAIIQRGKLTTFTTKYSGVRMCTEAVIIKQLTCCKFTSYSSHPAVFYSSTQIKMPSFAIHP